MTPEIAAKLTRRQESGSADAEGDLSDEEYSMIEDVWTGRKENHIQRAIEQMKGQSAVNCGYLFLNREDIALLVESLRTVNENPDYASAVLPTQNGFFFGGTQYDEWYFEDIKRELVDFEQILKDWDESAAYAYWAWW
jgi:hypothetical protein